MKNKNFNFITTIFSLVIALAAFILSFQAYRYNDDARKMQSYLALQEYRGNFNIELLDQVQLLNCYQYHIDEKRHELAELLMTEVNSRFEKDKYDKDAYADHSADSYLKRIQMYAEQRREIRMNLYGWLSDLRVQLEDNPNKRALADDRCKGGMFKPY
ncbi:MAG: hypothetical protein HWE16_02625 [Gammaproteobacteria bacterium]|nr:hypothetical protein [Gammaproteobacteria bacterium]